MAKRLSFEEAMKGLPSENTDETKPQKRLSFNEAMGIEPETTVFGHVNEFSKGLGAGAVNLLETGAIGASALLPDEMEPTVREYIEEVADTAGSPFEGSGGYEDTLSRNFAEAGGSILPYFGLAALGPPGWIAAGALGIASGAGEARVRAEEAGATEDEIETATQLGSLVGASELIPVAKFARALKLAGPSKKVVTTDKNGRKVEVDIPDDLSDIYTRGKRIVANGSVEGLQEFAAETAQNLIAKGVYDPEQGVFTNTGEALGYGAGVGGLVQAITDMVLARKQRKAGGVEPKDPEKSPEDLIDDLT